MSSPMLVSILLLDTCSSPILKQKYQDQTQSLLSRHQTNQKYIQKVKESARCLEFFPGIIKSKELAIYGLSQCGSYLNKCSDQLRNDELIVSIAVLQDGLALQWASDSLRRRKDIVIKAVQQNGMALKFAHPDLLLVTKDETSSLVGDGLEIIKMAILTTPIILEMDKQLISDRIMALELIIQNPSIFKYLSRELKLDREIQLKILSVDGKYLEFFEKEMLLCTDRELGFLAARNSKLAYPFIEKSLRNEIALESGDLTFVEKVSRIQIGDYALLTGNQVPCQIETIEKDYSSSKCGPSFKVNISGKALVPHLVNNIPIFMTYFASVSSLSALTCPFVYRITCRLIGISENDTLILDPIANQCNLKLHSFEKKIIPESVLNYEYKESKNTPTLEIIQFMDEQKILSIIYGDNTIVLSC